MNKPTIQSLRSIVDEIRKLLNETDVLLKGDSRCLVCNKVMVEPDDVAFVIEYGICVSCDTHKHDAEKELYEEVNNEPKIK